VLNVASTFLFLEIGKAKTFTSLLGRNLNAKGSSLILLYKSSPFTFRDVLGTPDNFRETFHDNGPTDIFNMMLLCHTIGFDDAIKGFQL
jgi:hypothetical protein